METGIRYRRHPYRGSACKRNGRPTVRHRIQRRFSPNAPASAILAPTHELKAEINAAVRQSLEDEGALRGHALEIERYVNLHLTRPQKGDIANYRPGDVAVFHHDVHGVGAKAGDACLVAKVDAGEGRVALIFPDGRERRIDPSGYIRYRLDLFETQPLVLSAGDPVR